MSNPWLTAAAPFPEGECWTAPRSNGREVPWLYVIDREEGTVWTWSTLNERWMTSSRAGWEFEITGRIGGAARADVDALRAELELTRAAARRVVTVFEEGGVVSLPDEVLDALTDLQDVIA